MTVTEKAYESAFGQPLRRKEDAHLITGQTRWVDNLSAPGMLYAAYLRSPMAHAKFRINTAPAKAYPGVVAVFSAEDFGAAQAIIPEAWTVHPDMKKPIMTPLATDEVRYAGEPVAVVVAESRYQATDALEAIEVDYDPLPAVVDMEAAARDEHLVHADLGTNTCFYIESPGEAYQAAKARAEAEGGVVISRRFLQQRLLPTPMEPRAVLVVPTIDDLTVYASTQIPHVLRLLLAMLTGHPEHKLRVVAPDVGGGFGGKINCLTEEIIGVHLAKRLGRPVKWTETRSENFLQMHHGRAQIQDIEIAATREGKLLGLKVDLLADMGAGLRLFTAGVPMFGAAMFNAIYKMDAYQFNCRTVFTNLTPTDAYRGAGRPEATYAIERMMDELANELGMDPIEVRRKNWISHHEFPYTTISGSVYDSGNYEAATDRALELFGYDELRAEQKARRDRGDRMQLGIGVSTFTEACGLAPSRVMGQLGVGAGGWERAEIRVTLTGKIQVVSGSTPHGQGHWTAWSQLVSDKLGVDFADVELLAGDTATGPQGMDTYGSRSLVVGGSAIVKACDKVIEKAKRIAAHTLEANPDDLEFHAGVFTVKGSPGPQMSFVEVAAAAQLAHNIPDGMEPSLNSAYTFDPVNLSYPHGTHLCAVEIDTETGRTSIHRYACVDDVGTVVNPMIVEGQIHGGLVQGIAQALFEEAVYDEAGNLITGTLVDYLVPSAADVPSFLTDRTETPSTDNPIGAKGVGEAGCIASTPAVVNAIVDALRPYGVNDIRMPCTPERVWRAIQGGAQVEVGSANQGGSAAESGSSAQSGVTAQREPDAHSDSESQGGAQ